MQRNLLAALVAGLFVLPVQAEDAFNLDEVVVTATRTARTADASLAAVTVLTRKDIERSQAQSLVEVLEGLAGVALSNNGGAGKATSVFLRGMASNHVVVLVDGVKIGSATLGSVALQDLPLALIDRIELVRGPASSLYGSEAMGGVIQVFTRKRGGPPEISAAVGHGADNTTHAEASVAGGGDTVWYSLGASYFETDGFNARDGAEPDDDGYRNRAFQVRGGARLGPGVELELSALTADGDVDYDGFYNRDVTRQQALGASLDWRVSDVWRTRLSLGQGRDQQKNYANGVFQERADTRRDTATWQNDWTLALDHRLTLGLERHRDTVDGTTAYAVDERVIDGVYGQYQGRIGGHDLRLALRRDDNSQFGDHVTGNLGWGVDLDSGLRLMASYGTGFRAPTFNDLYYPFSGNPALRPEQSRSLEVGVSGKIATGQWSVNAFATKVDGLIDWACVLNCNDADWNNDIWQPGNINEARIRGLESTLSGRWLGWSVRGALTLQDPENRSAANLGKVLIRRAKESARLDLDRGFGLWRLGATLRAEGRRYDDQANTVELPGYALLDLRGEYRLDTDWRLEGKLVNVFDRDYETAATYNQPGRGAYLTLRYSPVK